MNFFKHFFYLVIIYSFLFTALFILKRLFNIGLPFSNAVIILTSGLTISVISLLIFFRGVKKNFKSRIISILSALGLKFILYLFLLLVYYFLSKFHGTEFIITFFVIYLSFTYYLLKIFIQTMNNFRSEE